MIKRILVVFAAATMFASHCACADYSGGMEAYNKKDYATALMLLRPEAEKGNQIAQNIVGVIYMSGLGVSPNYVEAAKWFRAAAEQNYAVAQTNLGFLYENGRGIEQSFPEARKWYEKAAAQGDQRAAIFLKSLARKEEIAAQMRGVQPSPSTSKGKVSEEDRAKATEIARLALPPLNRAGSDLLLAKIYARSLDNPKRWNESSPEWEPVVEAIRKDVVTINEKFKPEFEELQHKRENMLSAYYADHLSGAQLNELVGYYHSQEGKRCQSFLVEINTVTLNAFADIGGNAIVSGVPGLGDLTDSRGLSAKEQSDFSKNADERLRVLKLSRTYRTLVAKNDARVAALAGNMIGAISVRYGQAVDGISKKYAADLVAFEKFSRSEAAQAEIAGLEKLGIAMQPAEKKVNNEYLAEITSYRAKWRQLYTSRIKRNIAPPGEDKT